MTRVVAILAHPDDAEILAGGTLYQHRQRGDSVGTNPAMTSLPPVCT